MKEINITEADIDAVAAWIAERRDYISEFGESEEDIRPTALKVIHCVLSLRANFDRVVKPRLDAFMSRNIEIRQVVELADLIESYPTPIDFIREELAYNSEQKAKMLYQVVKYVCKIVKESADVSEEDVLKKWAIHVNPQECYSLNIKHFKIAGFQYLRMLFGADTVKPDVHVHRCLSELLGRNVSDIEAILLLEKASKREGLKSPS